MGSSVQRLIDDDKPPAGTPCCVCRAAGHFCQADHYTAGDSGNGICDDCMNMRDCDTQKLKRRADIKPDTFSIPKVSDSEKQENRRKLIEHLLREGKTVRQIAHEENFSEHTIIEVRNSIPADELPKPRMGPIPGKTGKVEEKTQAANLLAEGKSIRQVAEETGLAKNTVLSVRDLVKNDLPEKCDCGEPLGHKGWCAPRLAKSPARQETLSNLHAVQSLSPVTQGKRATYVIPPETRAAIAAEPPDSLATALATKYGCSTASIDNIRRAAGVVPAAKKRGPMKRTSYRDVTMEKPKPEMAVATPVTIVTVPADTPKVDMTLSRAFELVMAEFNANIESMEDDKTQEVQDMVKNHKEIIATLHDFHPAFMGITATGCKPSIYTRALEQAESEVDLIEREIQRLTTRLGALKPILKALKEGKEAESDTR